jgi:tRNA (cmo5U34)-methyltransferase
MIVPTDWTFKSNYVAQGFDQHVREQLPWYDLMAGATAHIARHYLPEGGTVLDIGSSTGNLGALLSPVLETRKANYIAVDNSEQMAAAYRGPGSLVIDDVRTMEIPEHDVCVLFLVLMFVEPRLRLQILEKIAAKTRLGGIVIVVDKLTGAGGYLGTVLSRLALAGKKASGVSGDEIIDKELSLAGVQRPMALQELDGYTEVFRFGEFYGCVKEAAE